MAKVTITIEDHEGTDRGFGLVIDLDPPIKELDKATAAQLAAMIAVEAIQECAEVKHVSASAVDSN